MKYQLDNAADLSVVNVWATKGLESVKLASLTKSRVSNHLVNVGALRGKWSFIAVATDAAGESHWSKIDHMNILSTGTNIGGSFGAENFKLRGGADTAHVFRGRGGTDTLELNVSRSDVVSLNGQDLANYADPRAFAAQRQAIYKGTAYDYITLSDGREIYFQGIENLSFDTGANFELQRRTNDTYFGGQWNLHTTDVTNAWRFTRGSSGIILASLDTGLTLDENGNMIMNDLDFDRLITDSNDAETVEGATGHGHKSISIMSSKSNNGSGIAGINWNSDVVVHDVFDNDATNLKAYIEETVAYARATNKKVVFQAGIQTDFWLETNGYTQAELEATISDSSDVALYAIAATNGGPGGGVDDPNYLNSVAGVARLAATHDNVISVGALEQSGNAWVGDLLNTTEVNLAEYSNRGWNLTMVAPTDSPAVDYDGRAVIFNGTSCANPNLAGIASLVWSVKKSLTPAAVKQALVRSAMDVGDAGRDNTYGAGLVDADASVRRAWALKRDPKLAKMSALPFSPQAMTRHAVNPAIAPSATMFSNRPIGSDPIDTSCEDIVTTVA